MTSKVEKAATYNPSQIGLAGSLFGLPFNFEESDIVILPVPWDVTVSYGYGTHMAPSAILEASTQVDLYDFDNPDGWKSGMFMLDLSESLLAENKHFRVHAKEIIKILEKGGKIADYPVLEENLNLVNQACQAMNSWVFEQCIALLNRDKIVGLIGGDHSTPLGYMKALSTVYPDFGILQIDAHADLREAYEGFEYSHASVMFNALKIPQVSKLVQVGVRDIGHEEMQRIDNSEGRIVSFFDPFIKEQLFLGKTWNDICERIVKELPQNIYISFDIDGLDPKLCPSTGTPVPGGLEVEMIYHLISLIETSGKKIIGFDLVEVGNDEWDANVGARILYKLCQFTLLSRNKVG